MITIYDVTLPRYVALHLLILPIRVTYVVTNDPFTRYPNAIPITDVANVCPLPAVRC